jgi:hypothetical protein
MTPKPRNRAEPNLRRGESTSEAYQLTVDALDNPTTGVGLSKSVLRRNSHQAVDQAPSCAGMTPLHLPHDETNAEIRPRPTSPFWRRGSTGSLSRASTPNTHSCTRRKGSRFTKRVSPSIPRQNSRIAKLRLPESPRLRNRSIRTRHRSRTCGLELRPRIETPRASTQSDDRHGETAQQAGWRSARCIRDWE